MNAPGLKTIPRNPAWAGRSARDARFSGPRVQMVVLPSTVARTICRLLTAAEVKEPARSLWVRQILSVNLAFADLWPNTNPTRSPAGTAEPTRRR